MAKAVSDGGAGGMIVMSEASFHALPCAAKRSTCPHCILHMGEYSMEGKEGPSGLLLALPLDLIARCASCSLLLYHSYSFSCCSCTPCMPIAVLHATDSCTVYPVVP